MRSFDRDDSIARVYIIQAAFSLATSAAMSLNGRIFVDKHSKLLTCLQNQTEENNTALQHAVSHSIAAFARYTDINILPKLARGSPSILDRNDDVMWSSHQLLTSFLICYDFALRNNRTYCAVVRKKLQTLLKFVFVPYLFLVGGTTFEEISV